MRYSVEQPCIRTSRGGEGTIPMMQWIRVAVAPDSLREKALHDEGSFMPMHRLMFDVRTWCSVK